MAREFDRKLVLENGKEFLGYSFGAKCDAVCELVFNTSMVGYQEIISDPSYTDQMVLMTYPLIGSYGITDEDFETKNPTLGAMIVREYNDMPSNFRYTKTLSETLEENNIPAICGVDTRWITRILRDEGTQCAVICDSTLSHDDAMKKIKDYKTPKNSVERVSCKKRWYSRTSNHEFNVVAIDCGIRTSIIKSLNAIGCNVTIVPFNTSAADIDFMKPDGILISNGPGNPNDVECIADTIKSLRGKYPMLGICLGFELMCMAYGAKVEKMKVGHHGCNRPIKKMSDNTINMATENHGYCVNRDLLNGLEVTHIDLLDNTVLGVINKEDRVMGLGFQPCEDDSLQRNKSLFKAFADFMGEEK